MRRQPVAEGCEQRGDLGLTPSSSLVRFKILPGIVEVVELPDPAHRLVRQPRRLLGLGHLEELAPGMRPAADLLQRRIGEEPVVARIGVGDQIALPAGDERLRVDACAGMLFERRDERRILALYPLGKRQKVEPRFGMADTVRSVALKEYYRQMERALREELAKG